MTADENLSTAGRLRDATEQRCSVFFWGLSCAIHVVLLAALGMLAQESHDIPPPVPIHVSIVTTSEPGAPPALAEEANPVVQSHQPERQPLEAEPLARMFPAEPDPPPAVPPPEPLPVPATPPRVVEPVVPETPVPQLIEVEPEVQSVRPSIPLVEPERPVPPSPSTPPVTPPLAPPPPIAAQPTPPRLPQTSPTREVPKRAVPSTTFNDPLIARTAPKTSSPTPDTRTAERTPPSVSLPQASGVRYGQNPAPPYPSEARRRGWEGTVLLLVEIRENGRPERITIKQSSGHTVLDDAARGAVGRWTFIPAQRNGKPLRSLAEVPIVFSLRQAR